MKSKKLFTTREICYIGVFVAVIAVCAQILVPLPGGVNFTMQTWAVMLAGFVLGAKKGAVAAGIYILVGAVGMPVFSNFGGGFGVIAGPTGGFIVTFPIMAALAGLGARKKMLFTVAALLAAVAINLSVGMLWFSVVMEWSLAAAFFAAVAPFILPEVFKIAAVIVVGGRIYLQKPNKPL